MNINSFLDFGYDIFNEEHTPIDLTFNSISDTNHYSLDHLLDEIVKDNLTINDKIIVPVSGGVDSRLILSLLLRHLSPTEINTVTFGVPGSLDFELGNKVCDSIGTNHYAINLMDNENFEIKNLLLRAKHTKNCTSLFHSPPVEFFNQWPEHKIWSGFMGDPITGSKLMLPCNSDSDFANSKKNAIIRFLDKNLLCSSTKYYKNYFNYLYDNFKYVDCNFTMDEQIDFYFRQYRYVKPHVVFSGFDHITIFEDKRFVSFFEKLQHSERYAQYLYFDYCINNHKLFKLPIKNNYKNNNYFYYFILQLSKVIKKTFGIYASHPNENYLDFYLMYHSNEKFKKISDYYYSVFNKNYNNGSDVHKGSDVYKDFISKKPGSSFRMMLLVTIGILNEQELL